MVEEMKHLKEGLIFPAESMAGELQQFSLLLSQKKRLIVGWKCSRICTSQTSNRTTAEVPDLKIFI